MDFDPWEGIEEGKGRIRLASLWKDDDHWWNVKGVESDKNDAILVAVDDAIQKIVELVPGYFWELEKRLLPHM